MRPIAFYAAVIFFALPAVPVTAATTTPKLHPVKAACIDYKISGQMMNGTSTRCHRLNAYEQYEIQHMTMSFAGMKQSQNQHVITIGDTIYSINLDTKTATKTKNPLYDNLVAATKGKSAEEMGKSFISAMGFTPDGTTKTIAGHSCAVHNSSMMGTVCLTTDGLMLEQSFMGNTTRAVKVAVGESGDDANYKLYQSVPVTEGPDLSNLQNLMGGGR